MKMEIDRKEEDIETALNKSADERIKELLKSGFYKELKDENVQNAFKKLYAVLKPDTRIYTTILHYNPNSTMKVYQLTIPVCEDGTMDIWILNYYLKTLLGYKINSKWNGIKINGGDAWNIIYNLSSMMFNNGYLLTNRIMNY
jgi:hypothetical protein